jgi:protein-tyrosine phosphatase
MENWQMANPNNVILVHCKGGKGRSGSVVSYLGKKGRESGKKRF